MKMHKIKNIVLILSACLLIIACGCLPHFSVLLFKQFSAKKIAQEPIPSLSYESMAHKPHSITEKFSLLLDESQRIDVTESSMTSTHEDILLALKAYLPPFWEAKIFPQINQTKKIVVKPSILFDKEGRNFDMFWVVILILDSNGKEVNIYCVIDDENHHIFQLNYSIYPFSNEKCDQWLNQESTEQFCRLFFEDLNIDPEPLESDTPNTLLFQIQDEQAGNVILKFDKNEYSLSMQVTK